MKNKMLSLIATAVTFVGSSAFAQDSLIDYLVTSCESDIKNYCSQVTPGEGRMLHCMAAHEDKISGQCEYAFYQAASLLEQLSVAISYVAQECETEIQTLCNDVNIGDGRILACLAEHEEDVGESCKTAVAETVGE